MFRNSCRGRSSVPTIAHSSRISLRRSIAGAALGLLLSSAAAAESRVCLGFFDGRTGDETTSIADQDGDGVPDRQDLCVGVLPGHVDIDTAGCPTGFDYSMEKISFDEGDDKHPAWYLRFWTGECKGIGWLNKCFEDGRFWQNLMAQTLDRVGAEELPLLQTQLWSAGRYIGLEWARDNDVRRIDTPQLRRWYKFVGDAPNVNHAVRTVCIEAESLMSAD